MASRGWLDSVFCVLYDARLAGFGVSCFATRERVTWRRTIGSNRHFVFYCTREGDVAVRDWLDPVFRVLLLFLNILNLFYY